VGGTVYAERGRRVVRITIEVGNGATRYRVAVQAESIRRALEIVEGVNPGSDFRVTFPIDPEAFFVEDTAAMAGSIEPEKPAA
jgi:hypothetical protein